MISGSEVHDVLLQYGVKGRSLYARRGEPGDEATVTDVSLFYMIEDCYKLHVTLHTCTINTVCISCYIAVYR